MFGQKCFFNGKSHKADFLFIAYVTGNNEGTILEIPPFILAYGKDYIADMWGEIINLLVTLYLLIWLRTRP